MTYGEGCFVDKPRTVGNIDRLGKVIYDGDMLVANSIGKFHMEKHSIRWDEKREKFMWGNLPLTRENIVVLRLEKVTRR